MSEPSRIRVELNDFRTYFECEFAVRFSSDETKVSRKDELLFIKKLIFSDEYVRPPVIVHIGGCDPILFYPLMHQRELIDSHFCRVVTCITPLVVQSLQSWKVYQQECPDTIIDVYGILRRRTS